MGDTDATTLTQEATRYREAIDLFRSLELVVAAVSSVAMGEGTWLRASKKWVVARSRFRIVLSAEERVELQRRVACYTLPHKVVQRTY